MDHRDLAAVLSPWMESYDPSTQVATFWLPEERHGAETLVDVACVNEVCPTCEGRGTHVNPSIDAHGISPDEFTEDPDFAEAYFSGRYDVRCYQCKGANVVPVPDPERNPKGTLDAIDDSIEDAHAFAQECAAERRAGC